MKGEAWNKIAIMSRNSTLIRSQKAWRIIHEIVVYSKTIRQNTRTRKEKGPSENQFCQNVSPGKSRISIEKHWYANKIMWNINQSPDCARISWEYIDVFLIYFVAASKCVALPFLDFDDDERTFRGWRMSPTTKFLRSLGNIFEAPVVKFSGDKRGRGEWKIERNEMRWKFNVRVKNLFIENHLAVKIINFE